MKKAIIIHGWPDKEEFFDPKIGYSPSNSHWLPWLQWQLGLKGILTQTPEMWDPYEPVYEKWLEVFNQFDVDEHTILIGHSCGAGFFVRWLSENKIKVQQLLLVAPFLDTDQELGSFFNFDIDENLVNKTKNGINILYSTDDESYILESVKILKDKIKNISIKEFTDKGHFTTEDGVSGLPEILEFIK